MLTIRELEHFFKACSKSWKKAQRIMPVDTTFPLGLDDPSLAYEDAMLAAIKSRRIDSVRALFAIQERWVNIQTHLIFALQTPTRSFKHAWKPSPQLKEIIKELIWHAPQDVILDVLRCIMVSPVFEFHFKLVAIFLAEAKVSLCDYEIPPPEKFWGSHQWFAAFWTINMHLVLNKHKRLCNAARTFDLVLMLCDGYFVVVANK